jgi:hypothetical protein
MLDMQHVLCAKLGSGRLLYVLAVLRSCSASWVALGVCGSAGRRVLAVQRTAHLLSAAGPPVG